VISFQNVKEEQAEQGAHKVTVRWLITKDDGAENFTMRYFTVAPQGFTPYHSHDWEHEVFILDGQGVVKIGDHTKELEKGIVIFIPPNVRHQFTNPSAYPLRFICMIPNQGAS
jgi:quercetin dioxygenase-like cupin family protein